MLPNIFKSKIFKAKYLSKEQQIKRGFIKGVAISVVVVAGVVILYQTIVIPEVRKNEKIRVINNIKKEKALESKAWVLTKNIKQGDAINIEKDLKEISLPGELLPDNCSNKKDIKDKVVKMNLSAKTVITNSVLLSKSDVLTPDLRKQDYSHIIVNKNLQKGNFVDIRLKKKDGSDYVVASKKQITDLNGNTIITKITEEERTLINNATVEASITGAVLYTTIYVDPENQIPALVTYEINTNIKDMIKNNPKVVKDAEQQLQNKNSQNTTNSQQSNSSSEKPQFVDSKEGANK